MLQSGERAPHFSIPRLGGGVWQHPEQSRGKPTLLAFIETDCPTCHVMLPYLERLSQALPSRAINILGISQDSEPATRRLFQQMRVSFPVAVDRDLIVSRNYDPIAVPALFLLDSEGRIVHSLVGFDKEGLNSITRSICQSLTAPTLQIADPYDGSPDRKPGCVSRHREIERGESSSESDWGEARSHYGWSGPRATHIELADDVDPYEYCAETFGDPLPVIPPTVERVEQMVRAAGLPPAQTIGHVPPNYGVATVEKIAANAVMAGCKKEMMKVLIPLVRAACDERFNLHGVQATTHFAAPLIIINGPVREELGFACGSNVFSNVSRANSTLGRAFQLILTNLGGARPGEIDMSTLGNPGKFSYCIAENEEESPWEPFHVERGFHQDQSALTLFAAEPQRGVSEHYAREAKQILKAISRALQTVWTYRMCGNHEALVVLCPEHVQSLHREGFGKQDVRDFLFEKTAIPIRDYEGARSEGTQYTDSYVEVRIDGEPCYRKFREPEAIKILVAGGTAGKFSAVIGSWATGPRGSQMVTYPID